MLRLALFALLSTLVLGVKAKYEANWDSLDSRPLPAWYDGAKIGIFIHWGVYSVPAFGSEWFWIYWKGYHRQEYIEFMEKNYRPGFTYADFAADFTAEFYDPEEWARVFEASGARYVVLTSKHHEGYTLWPSENSFNWNAHDVGPNRDLLGDLATAIRNTTPHIHFGVYHSLFEWFNPLYLRDLANVFTTNQFPTTKIIPDLHHLVMTYEPEIIWSDGDGGALASYWGAQEFLAWLFNDSPVNQTVVVNDRWGLGIACHHGSFYTCTDRYNPGVLQPHKWENAMTLDRGSWGYRRDATAEDFITIEELLTQVVSTVSCGGNILVNIGPTHDGRLPPIMEERLRQMGSWLEVNGDAIYDSQPWTHQNDSFTPGVWYTFKPYDQVYAMVLTWPKDDLLILKSVRATPQTHVAMLGYYDQDGGSSLEFTESEDGIEVRFPRLSEVESKWAWTLEMSEVRPSPLTLPTP